MAATFTIDPLLDPLSLLLREAGTDFAVEVAPHAQVFQALLHPGSAFARNHAGVNVVLVRFEDWFRGPSGPGEMASGLAKLQASVADLVVALRTAATSSPTPIILGVCPPSPRRLADARSAACLASLESRLAEETAGIPNLHPLPRDVLGRLDPAAIDDAEGDRLAQVPYTPIFFAALGIAVARLVHALKSIPPKVLVLDCDGTLWSGAVGEEGAGGVQITPRHRALQTFALTKKRSGMLLCLASKNVEPDVLEVFTTRPDMLLRLEDLVATRLNWQPKSENLRSLAAELNLGLESLVFIDDNPIECAEIEARCPGVLVIRLPVEEDFPRFVANVWPLDIVGVTDEDRKRSELYRANLDRQRFARSTISLDAFLSGLELRVDIGEPGPAQRARVAQLTHRTNQFNLTTRRRSEAEIERLSQGGRECRVVEVTDRFGEYGLVGVMIFTMEGDALVIDTLLLSCRVLGRGVEHWMLRELGGIALARGASQVVAPFIPTERNQPARRFLDSLATATRKETEAGATYTLLAAHAKALEYDPSSASPDPVVGDDARPRGGAPLDAVGAVTGDAGRSARWARVARDFDTPEKIVDVLTRAKRHERRRDHELVQPRTGTERALARLWGETLALPEVGIRDDYFDLGGTSLLAVTLFARIEREMGNRLPLAMLTECPTIEALARAIDGSAGVHSLVLLNQGGDAGPLFLVHDADGETLLYRNLARRMRGRPVFGLQPPATADLPILYTRIEDLAGHYIGEIRKVSPRGPYLLGGLCAGGVLAFEMARQLEGAGEEARLVAVLDAADVEAPRRPHRGTLHRLSRLHEAIHTAPSMSSLPRVVADKALGYLSYQVTHRLKAASVRAAVALLRACLDRDWPVPPLLARQLSIRAVYNDAEARYRPHGLLDEEILLFRATSGVGAEEPHVDLYLDPLLGWGRRTRKGVRAMDVPGGHGSLLQEPNVAVIADALNSYLLELEGEGEGESAPPLLTELRRTPRLDPRIMTHHVSTNEGM